MTNNKDAIICIAAGRVQLPLIIAARDRGLDVVAIDRDTDAVGLKYVDEHIAVSTLEVDEVLKRLTKLQATYNYLGVVCRSSGIVLYTAAAISAKFNLRGLTQSIVPVSTEKSKLRELCQNVGIRMAKGYKAQSSSASISHIDLPIIVKPDLPITGKKNITVIWEEDQLADSIQSACSASMNQFAEIEEFIQGADCNVLFTIDNGEAKIITFWDEIIALNQDSRISGLGVSVPSIIHNTPTEKSVGEIVSIIARNFSDVQALLILSYRVDMVGNIYIIELHSDLGGDLIADVLLPTADGKFNYFDIALDHACGRLYKGARPRLKPTALLYDSSRYTTGRNNWARPVDNNLLLSTTTLEGLHRKLDKLIKPLDYRLRPLHYDWLNKSMGN
jgi:hypothetical protein